jgi:raffinose synthase
LSSFALQDAQLSLSGELLIEDVSDSVRVAADPAQLGVFLSAEFGCTLSRFTGKIGAIVRLRRFLACHRYEPFWMLPKVGQRTGEIPAETQFLLIELASGSYAVFVPLIDSPYRASLGSEPGALTWVIESGDPHLAGPSACALFLALGQDPFELVARAASAVAKRLGSKLRSEQPLARFADAFGWCTWDAFYQAVSHDLVREGLSAFQRAGLTPKMMILDDGWQCTRRMPTGEQRLTSFAANQKFPGGLRSTVAMARQEFGIETFLVWHALHGYWGGVDGEALPGYGVVDTMRAYSPGILAFAPHFNEQYWGPLVGLLPPHSVARFFDDYHRELAAQGVDGVKVDNQASTEALGHELGGRVVLTHAYRAALESSVAQHFGGRLIHCMSCSNDLLYSANACNLTRSSTDFWPNRPESHGQHLYTNACFGVWFGQFVHPDWDMFQSGHALGAFHAAARAVSGSPVYVSDKPDQINASVLCKLVTSDGSVLRARDVGRLTPDGLFRDPTREAVLLKIFNFNLEAGVIGVFNARHSADASEAIQGSVSIGDLPGLSGAEFAVYRHCAQTLQRATRADALPLALAQHEFEIFSFVPIDAGFAAIGLTDKYNSAGAVSEKGWQGNCYLLELRDGGEFLAFSARKPSALWHRGQPIAFSWEQAALRATLGSPGALRVEFD